jgi:small ubiquitin-related modifier
MNSYCERQGKSVDSVKFMWDGNRVQKHHTPADLEMEDGDTIEVMVEQQGGFQ